MRYRMLVGLVLTACVPTARAGDELTRRFESLMGSPGYESGRWGLLVVDAKTDAVLFERNADQLFRPASVTKLFSTAAALLELGPDYRFETPVVRRGEVGKDGTLHGDLILVAQGDPSMGGRTGPGGELLFVDNDHSYASANSRSAIVAAEPLAGLDHLAREVQAAGIKAVRGDVLIDDRIFEPAASTGSGPQRVVPIVINDNVVDVIVTPGAKPGDPASVRLLPETTFVTADAVVSTGPEGSTKDVSVRSVGPRRFKVRGQVPAGSGPSFHIYEVDEPVSFARALFIEQLRARGVRVEASPLSENNQDALPPRDQIPTLPRVAQYVSPPLRQYLRVILKVSQNLHASMLPLLVAAHRNQRTLEEGLRQEGALLQSLGLEISKFSFGGGAGGSPADLVTPRATVALLKAMTKRPEYPAYYEALPILGRDGTLAQSVSAESPARGHVRAKTGTFYVHDGLTGKTILTSKALAGYLETASGRSVVFAFFLNDVPLRLDNGDISEATAAAGRLLGKLCEAVYDDTAQADPNSSQVLP